MGSVTAAHRSPKAPRERDWDWDGTEMMNRIIEERGWDGVTLAHAWHDTYADPEHDPPREKEWAPTFPMRTGDGSTTTSPSTTVSSTRSRRNTRASGRAPSG